MIDFPSDPAVAPSTRSLKRSWWNLGKRGGHRITMTFGDASEAHAWALWLLERSDERRRFHRVAAERVNSAPVRSAPVVQEQPAVSEPPKGHWRVVNVQNGLQRQRLKQFVLDT